MTLDEAEAIFAQPKARGRAAAAPPLRELGPDPVTQGPILLKEGRFGPYVTDGETNASLRKGDEVDSITPERAAELLSDRRAAGPSTRKKKAPAKKKATTKKAGAAKKTAAKKTATTTVKKAGAKKAAAKKAAAKTGVGTARSGVPSTAAALSEDATAGR